MAIFFEIQRTGNKFRAKPQGGDAFFVGIKTVFTEPSSGSTFEGLFNVPTNDLPDLLYAAADMRAEFGFWADFIAPTSACEGGNYLTLNTYDRAAFTWGFGQFAAHVPDGDFVMFFRDMLQRPEKVDYFPDLTLAGGRIARASNSGTSLLETADSTAGLMAYLNPSTQRVEDDEVIAAAKLIHWTTTIAAAQALQVHHMVAAFERLMARADTRLGLDGQPAAICCVICDILHQGRGKFSTMQQALGSARPLTELLKIGAISFPDRIRTLKRALADNAAHFDGKVWSRQQRGFV